MDFQKAKQAPEGWVEITAMLALAVCALFWALTALGYNAGWLNRGENKYKGKLLMDKERSIKDFVEWLTAFCGRYCGARHGDIQVTETESSDEGEKCLSVRIFTEHNEYRIIAVELMEGKSYLGCATSSRAPDAGENHIRGCDLANGPLTMETWIKILSDIVGQEMAHIRYPIHFAESDEPGNKIIPFGQFLEEHYPEFSPPVPQKNLPRLQYGSLKN